MLRVAVVGGGLAGLTVAWRLSIAGNELIVLDGGDRLGGQLHTERSQGFVVEQGAEGFTARSTAVPRLAADLGIESQLVNQLLTQSFGFDGQRLHVLAPGEAGRFLGFQVAGAEFGHGIRAFAAGMQTLSDELERQVQTRASIRRQRTVRGIERAGGGYRLDLGEGEEERADAVVIATSARAAAALLGGTFGESAYALVNSPTLSSVSVSLAYRREQLVHALDGTGFVVDPAKQQHGFRACTFSSSKFQARAPASHALLRLFFRPLTDDLTTLSDAAWAARAHAALSGVLSVQGKPEQAWVARWKDALPVFDAGHRERVKALEERLAGSRILLGGAAFHGAGIDAAVCSAEAAAQALSVK